LSQKRQTGRDGPAGSTSEENEMMTHLILLLPIMVILDRKVKITIERK
jgi:hypothetical protein